MASYRKLLWSCCFAAIFITTWYSGGAAAPAEEELSKNISLVLEDGWVPPDYIQKGYPYYIAGRDYEGRPVVVVEAGHWDYRKAAETGGEFQENLDRHTLRFVETMRKLSKRTSNDIYFKDSTPDHSSDGAVVIADLADMDYLQVTSPRTLLYMLRLARTCSVIADYVPYGYLINVNYAAELFINAIRPALSRLFDKFEIVGTNKERWLPKLLDKIPRNQLPPWYGGEKDYKPVAVFG